MNVLIVSSTRTAIPLAIEVAKSAPDVEFTLYAEQINDQHTASAAAVENLKVAKSRDEVLVQTARFDALVTFGASGHPAHRVALVFSQIFSEQQRPRLEIQHGLIQEGVNAMLNESFVERRSFTDQFLKWADTGIPLPKFERTVPSAKKILVTTNLHWEVYSHMERSVFQKSILDLCRDLPDYDVIWKQHPAEFTLSDDSMPTSTAEGFLEPNLRVLSFDETEKLSFAELSHSAAVWVTTPSTTIVDAERHGAPCIVFDAKRLRPWLEDLEEVTTFYSSGELKKKVRALMRGETEMPVRTGHKFGFNAADTIRAAAIEGHARPRDWDSELRTAFAIHRSMTT
ncbi:MAG: hypothetical protein ACK4MY_00435 [Brevundimonas sp.]